MLQISNTVPKIPFNDNEDVEPQHKNCSAQLDCDFNSYKYLECPVNYYLRKRLAGDKWVWVCRKKIPIIVNCPVNEPCTIPTIDN